MKTLLPQKSLTLILFLLMMICLQLGSAQDLQWINGYTSGLGAASATKIDASGNVYLAGGFAGTVDFDPGPGTTNLTSAGSFDIYISKLDASGNLIWAHRIGGSSNDGVGTLELDASGNVYVTGWFQESNIDFNPGAGTNNLTSVGGTDVYVLKLNSAGTFQWVYQGGGSSPDEGHGLAIDGSGNVYVAGDTNGGDFDNTAGTTTLGGNGLADVFVVQLNSSGIFQWGIDIGGTGRDEATALKLESSGDLFVGGIFSNTVDFDPSASTSNKTSNGLLDAFLVQLNSGGTYQDVTTWGGTANDGLNDFEFTSSGTVVATSYFDGTIVLDPFGGSKTITSNSSNPDQLIQHFNMTEETVLWFNQIDITSAGLFGIDIDANDRIYHAGFYSLFGIVEIYDVDGNEEFSIVPTFGMKAYGAEVEGTNFYVHGSFTGNRNFDLCGGTHNVNGLSGDKAYVAKYAIESLADAPTLTATATSIFPTESTTISIQSGSLNSAADWQWYSGSCGGTSVGSGTSVVVSPTNTTTYYARGEGYSCITEGNCASITITVEDPFLTYGSFYNLSGGVTNSGNSFDFSSETTSVRNFTFRDDGLKLFVLAGNRNIYQYSLSTAFDLTSTITHDGSPYATGMNEPREMQFNPDGTKLFIVDNKLNQITQFSLTTPFDITSGVSSDGNRSVQAQTGSNSAWGIAFNANGSKMLISGIVDDLVHQYTLETPYDVTASVTYDNVTFDPTNELLNPTFLTFNPEGTILYISNHQYSLSTPFDISSGVTPVGSGGLPNNSGLHFSDDGTKLFLASDSDDSVHEYLINTGGFVEAEENDGSLDGSLLVSITGDTFTNAGSTLTSTTDYTITNLPTGLTPTLTVAASGLSATLTLSGSSTAHQDVNDLAGLEFTFENSAFTNSAASAVLDAIGHTASQGIDFNDNNPVLVYDQAYNPTNFAFDGTHSVSAQEGSPSGITFNDDGTKVYIVGTTNDQVFQYSLTNPFDVTTGVTLDGNSVSLNAQDDSPVGLAFNDDGTSLFIAGASSESILEYTLTTPYDVTTGFSFSSTTLDASGEGSPSGLAFSEDGMKLFVVSATTDQVSQYALTTAFDISTGVTVDGSYSVLNQDNTANGVAFSASGTKMIVIGASPQTSEKEVHNYHLATPYDITSGVTPYQNPVNVRIFEVGPSDIAFSNNGDRMFVVGYIGDEINQFDMQVGSMSESASDDGSVTGSYTLQVYDEWFTNAGGTLTQGADYNMSNLPAGLSSSLAVAADGKTATLSVTGTATSHDNAADVESLNFTFENSAFSIGDASIVAHATSASSELAINFIEAPSIGNQTFSVPENSTNETVVGTVAASGEGTLTYSITAGNDLGGFAIDTNSGEITVADIADMDFETNPSFGLTVEVSDGSLTNTATITIDLTNVPETPTDLAVDVSAIDENNAVNDVIGQLSTTDVDAGETYTYTLVSGTGDTDNASFNIDGTDLRASETFDFEAKDTYVVRVQTDDGNSGTFAKSISININNVFEAPTAIGLFGNSIAENNSINDEISTLSTTDQDAGETYTYTLVSGTGDDNNGSFVIAGNKLQAGEVFDFETKDSYSVRIQTSDGNGNNFSDAFTITITNEVANITDIALDSENVNENEISGSAVGLLSTIGTEVTGTITYSLVAGTGDTDNASFAISGTQLTTASVFDFETDASYAIRIRTDDGEGVTFDKAFTIAINDVSEAPTDMALSASSINENNTINATIGTLSTTDEDAGETYTYALAAGAGDTDNTSFNVSGNLLRASEVFNFESKNSYSLRLQTNDGNGGTYEEVFNVTVNDVSEAPSDLALSNSAIVENNSVNEVIGTLSTIDEDAGESFIYSLVSGGGDTDNLSFNILGNELRASSPFDFETQNTFSVRIQTNDGNGGNLEEVFSISVSNEAEAPTDLVLSSSDIDESSPVGSTVGTLSTEDEDNGETYTYTLVNGTGDADNASFTISGNELQSAEIFDFETKTSYSVRIETNDGNGGLLEKSFTININNLPPGLTSVGITSNSIDENLTAGSAVGDLFALGDEIEGVSFTFSFVVGSGDTDNASFSIVGGQLRSGTVFDYEFENEYSIRVMADDGAGSTIEQIILIDVNDVNEAPSDLLLSASSIGENNSINETIGSFSTTDVDAGDTHTYSLVSGSGDEDNTSFTIVGALLQAAESFDFEGKSLYSIRMQTSDGNGGNYEEVFSISVTDQNDEPTALSLDISSINENNAVSAAVGSFSTTDQDSGDSFTYTLVSGAGDTDNASFSVAGNQLQAGSAFDFESKNSFSIRVQTSDGNGGLLENSFTISVNDVNENPTDIALSNANLEESNPSGTLVGSFSSTDQDSGQTFTYSLVAGSGDIDNTSFSISGDEILSAEVFDFETKSSYSVRVQTADGNGGTYEKAFTISITDLPASITSFTLSSNAIDENLSSGSTIGSFSTSGEDLTGSFTYSLVSGSGDADNAAFSISGDQLLTAASFDFETKSSYSLRVMTDDGNQSEELAFSISINDVSEAPTALALSASSIDENNDPNDVIGTFSTTDEDAGETHTYSLVSGSGDNDNASFAVVGSELQAAVAFDFETQSSYSVRIETNDGNGGTLEQSFSISINNMNEAPVLPNVLSDITVTQGFVSSQRNVATAFTDPDGDELTLTTSSSDESIVTSELQGTTLVVSGPGVGMVVITLTADDGNGGITSATFNFTVEEAAQAAPTAIDLSSTTIDENLPANTVVADISSTDINPNDVALYALVPGDGDEDNGSFSISGSQLLTSEIFDFDAKSSYSIRLEADDQNGGTFEQTFTITVNDLGDNAAPTVTVALSDLSESVGFTSTQVDLATTFSDTDGDNLTISAASSDESVATVQVISGDQVQIDEVGIGTSTITVTADDGNGGMVSDEFIITVSEAPNNVPTVVSPLTDSSLEEGFATSQISYANVFEDIDGDGLTITVSSSDETVVTAEIIAGDLIQINEAGIGTSTITVTADDGNGGMVSDEFVVTVNEAPNNAPTVVNPLTDSSLEEGFGSSQISYANVFEDADGDDLVVTVSTSDETVVTTEIIAGDLIQINEIGIGTSTITVTANDGNGGMVSGEFIVTVSEAPNNAPTVVDPISDQTMLVEGFDALQINYSTTFDDADGDDLAISVVSSDQSVVTATLISNNQIQINEVGIGTSTITVTADDGNGGMVSDEFIVTVSEAPNNAPTVLNPFTDSSSEEGFAISQISYANVFEDPDGDDLIITVTSSDETVVTAEVITGDQIQVNEVGIGTSTITVTADDGNGGTVSGTFTFEVTERPLGFEEVVEISIYPNPVLDFLKISANEELDVTLTTIDGKLLEKENGMDLSMDLRSLGSGVYLLTINDGTSISHKRIVKAN